MKRISSSDSLGALMSMCPNTEEHSPRSNYMYNREYQSMLDGLDEECLEEYGHVPEKKRRLRVDQVKELERHFEVENKLEPERKVKLAQELGLQPRQVAVWFQNRRARWKTKQLERDYGVLKANFDSLQKNYESLKLDKQALIKEVKELKLKLKEENPDENMPNMEEETTEAVNLDSETDISKMQLKIKIDSVASFPCSELKSDGQSDSDSSAILNEEQSPNTSNSTSGGVQNQEGFSSSFIFNSYSSSSHCFSLSASNSDCLGGAQHNNVYHPQFVKLEQHNFFGSDENEACNLFAEEQAPSLHWYCADDQWV